MTGFDYSKINNGCINIFKFLILLYEDNAYYDKVVNIFREEITDKKDANLIQVYLNKYINAMRVFGIKINKDKNKFVLDSSLYSINYSLEDLKSLSILVTASEAFPDQEISADFKHLAANLLLRMSNSDKNTLNTYQTNYDFSFFYSDFKTQLVKCKQYCKDRQQLEIIYLKQGKEIKCKCIPKELVYDYRTAYLKIYDLSMRQNFEIALPNILSINVLPQVSNNKCEKATTVVFQLKGRLAKSYKFKENEHLQRVENDSVFVVNEGEPFDKLCSRLMRYSNSCEIMSPKFLRDEMIKLIENTIELYE